MTQCASYINILVWYPLIWREDVIVDDLLDTDDWILKRWKDK